jgi:hypothetical protein
VQQGTFKISQLAVQQRKAAVALVKIALVIGLLCQFGGIAQVGEGITELVGGAIILPELVEGFNGDLLVTGFLSQGVARLVAVCGALRFLKCRENITQQHLGRSFALGMASVTVELAGLLTALEGGRLGEV